MWKYQAEGRLIAKSREVSYPNQKCHFKVCRSSHGFFCMYYCLMLLWVSKHGFEILSNLPNLSELNK